jgi:hypothetical protein
VGLFCVYSVARGLIKLINRVNNQIKGSAMDSLPQEIKFTIYNLAADVCVKERLQHGWKLVHEEFMCVIWSAVYGRTGVTQEDVWVYPIPKCPKAKEMFRYLYKVPGKELPRIRGVRREAARRYLTYCNESQDERLDELCGW